MDVVGAGLVEQFEQALRVTAARLHRRLDVLDRGVAGVEHLGGVVEVRVEQGIDDEARAVLADDRRPTGRDGERTHRLDGLVADGDRTADLEHLTGLLLLVQDDGHDGGVDRRVARGRGLDGSLAERSDDACVTDGVTHSAQHRLRPDLEAALDVAVRGVVSTAASAAAAVAVELDRVHGERDGHALERGCVVRRDNPDDLDAGVAQLRAEGVDEVTLADETDLAFEGLGGCRRGSVVDHRAGTDTVVGVEAVTALAAEATGRHQLAQDRRRGDARVTRGVVEHAAHLVDDVEADEVAQRERAHRQTDAGGHGRIDVGA